MAALGTGIERRLAVPHLRRDLSGVGTGRDLVNRVEEAIAEGAAVEPHLGSEGWHLLPEFSHLSGNIGPGEEDGVRELHGKVPVPCDQSPVLRSGPSDDLLVRAVSNVGGVVAEETEIPGESAEHLVDQPPGFVHPSRTPTRR